MRMWWIGVAILAALPATATPQTSVAVKVAQKTSVLDFSYTYPAAAAQIAPLRRWLDGQRAALRARALRDATADRREAAKSGFPFREHDATTEWKVVTDTPRLLSLSVESYRYAGGAHGGTAIDSVVWDKARGRRVAPRAMFVSDAALQDLLGPTWCAKLKAERVKRLGSDIARDDIFPCPAIDKLTLLLGSTDGRAIDRIGLIAGQYVAGAYAEGMYEVTLPVTPALLRIVQPAWREVFAVR